MTADTANEVVEITVRLYSPSDPKQDDKLIRTFLTREIKSPRNGYFKAAVLQALRQAFRRDNSLRNILMPYVMQQYNEGDYDFGEMITQLTQRPETTEQPLSYDIRIEPRTLLRGFPSRASAQRFINETAISEKNGPCVVIGSKNKPIRDKDGYDHGGFYWHHELEDLMR